MTDKLSLTGIDTTEEKYRRTMDTLREREAEISAILNSVPAFMLLIDADRRVLKANQAAADFAGCRIEDMVGQPAGNALRCLYSTDDPRGCGFGPVCQTCVTRLTLDDTLQTSRSHSQVETVFRRQRGDKTEELICLLYTSLLNLPEKKVLVFIHDVNEVKRSERQIMEINAKLTQHAADLEAANRELESFSYSVSHDLRAPLRSMEGFSQALLEDYADRLDDQARDYLKRIQASSQLMGQLIDDILELSRIARRELRKDTVSLSEMAREVADELRATEPERQVTFDVAPGLRASADPRLLRIVMQNIIGNAWKFTGKTPAARIEFGGCDHQGKPAFFVRDNGIGFDMAYSDKLFTPFQRLHKSSQFPGTGVGLASVHRIISRHGGRIWAEAEPGKGATFFFTLG